MKVIIDIPDDVIAEKSYCKYFGCLSTKLLEIIENSIPVNTDGDTISRSALKELKLAIPFKEIFGRRNGKFKELIVANYQKGWNDCIDNIIDNAPTVEPICPYLSDDEVKQPCIQAPCERPKGEWIESHIVSCGKVLQLRADILEHKCNKCERWSIKWAGTIPDNFCSNCGAKMGGE